MCEELGLPIDWRCLRTRCGEYLNPREMKGGEACESYIMKAS
jgi:hypothetical protein